MREMTKDSGAEFSSEKQEFSASTPISSTYNDCNQTTKLSCSQTTVYCTSSSTVVSTTSVSPIFFPESSNVLTCDATLPVTSSSILETAALLSGITEYSDQGGFLVTSAYGDEVQVCEEESQIRVSTLQGDLHLSDSDSDDEASDSDVEDDKDLLDTKLKTTNENNLVQLRLSAINESEINFSEYSIGSENTSFGAIAASSYDERISSSEDDSSTDTEDSSSDDDNDSVVDDSSSSQSDASSTDNDESDAITNGPLPHRKPLDRDFDVLLSYNTSSTGVTITGELSYPEARGQKRKREDEYLHYLSKRRKVGFPLPSTSTGFTGSRKIVAPCSVDSKNTLGSKDSSFLAYAASSNGERTSSTDDDSLTDTEDSSSDDDHDDAAVDDSSSSQSDASSTDRDEPDESTNDQLMHRKPLHRTSGALLPNRTSSTEGAHTSDASYTESKGQKRKREDEGLDYPSKKRKIESIIPNTSSEFTKSRKRQSSDPVENEAFNRAHRKKKKEKKMYLDSQIYSCPSTCPCKTRGRANRIPSIERTFKVIKPLYMKLLQSRTIDSSNLSRYPCCKKYCSFRWFRRRIPNHVLLDDYWASDLDVHNFSWGQWKDGQGQV